MSAPDILQNLQFEDISSKIEDFIKDLKSNELITSESFTLYESMSAIEIMDPKMDFKTNLSSDATIEALVKSKKIKMPEELSIKELNGLIDELTGQEFLWLTGLSFPHTVFSFSYLYDPAIYQNSKILKSYFEAFFECINIAQDLTRRSPYLREEDYIPSVFNVVSDKKEDELVSNVVNAEYEIADNVTKIKKKKKKNEDKEEEKIQFNEYDGLNARLKLRRGLVNLYTNLSQKFTLKRRDEIANNITFCIKNLDVVKETINQSDDCSNYLFTDLPKTLLCHLPPRKLTSSNKTETYEHITRMLSHFTQILELTSYTNFYAILRKLDDFSKQGRNIFTRAYLDLNLFSGNGKFFNHYDVTNIALETLKDFGVNTKELATQDSFNEFVKIAALVVEDYHSQSLKNRCKQRREFSKLYRSLNRFVHDSYTLDETYNMKGEERQNTFLLWSFDIAVKLMIKQISLGFELELYQERDYPIVFYLLHHMLLLLDRNNATFITRFDKEFLLAYQTKTLVDKKKKRLPDYQRKVFYESIVCKGLENYCKVMMRLTQALATKNIIKSDENDEALAARYSQRMKIFENVFFIRRVEFEEFKKARNDINGVEWSQNMKDMKAILDNTVKMFNEISAEETIDATIKDEIATLKRVFVMNSMALMKLEMNKDKLDTLKATFSNKLHPFYPVCEISNK